MDGWHSVKQIHDVKESYRPNCNILTNHIESQLGKHPIYCPVNITANLKHEYTINQQQMQQYWIRVGFVLDPTLEQHWIRSRQYTSNIGATLDLHWIQLGIQYWGNIAPIFTSNIGAILESNVGPILNPILPQYWGNIGVLSGEQNSRKKTQTGQSPKTKQNMTQNPAKDDDADE